jgi:hypothetical protein
MNAPCFPFPVNPCACAPFNGSRVVIQVFTSSGLYTPSPGLITAVVEAIGGGGASGIAYTQDDLHSCGGGGGGSGAYARKALPAALLVGGVTVTIGAGGAAPPNGVYNGGPGGATSFGALCSANGGGGGHGNDLVSNDGLGGLGGQGGVGDFVVWGTDGGMGDSFFGTATAWPTMQGGAGAVGPFGGGRQGLKVGPGAELPGAPGIPNTGAGASGGVIHQLMNVNGVGGQPGGSGVCIVTEYCAPLPTAGGSGQMVNVPAWPHQHWQQWHD